MSTPVVNTRIKTNLLKMDKDSQTSQEKSKNKKEENFFRAHGRRKEATARVRLIPGKGQTIVNEKPITEYFPGEVSRQEYLKPFLLTQTEDKYYATVKVTGSGRRGQLGAVIHGISRALNIADEKKFRPILKKAGLLTRDPRIKERRKYGRAQKARKGKQSPRR
ncbi:MAG: 30S ribosomal protein S9 [Candidatus Curtissbacteria bacterium GW2011_GWA1_41_11]|uniref:Small ribosomal subunit protein uS9 n=1 Tax=Candidatus Curtissbacteria bacterium GW2011_GWA1_41_11 TaxID=1618409 RepID=A0A0G0WTB6_9BACT|nr:MAG: 30S ribosomal protein S9 [Candidatus Curtissbacteria bacterium GW2011_GWA1_41_11]